MKQRKEPKHHIAAYVDKKTYEKLVKMCEEQNRSISFVVGELIEKLLENK